MWNSIGIVRGYNDEQDNAIDIEFHDTAVHHAMHLTNSLGHSMADVSQEAVLLACPSTDELARYITSVLSMLTSPASIFRVVMIRKGQKVQLSNNKTVKIEQGCRTPLNHPLYSGNLLHAKSNKNKSVYN